ncbi:T9SS type A sorting domain-containing protein [Flavobacterium sp.]|uniref:pectate lyase family protein n=1 Tax=Flavobacterium sp. TaxID=239 RepID=UPI002B5E80BD|nr:T9SS type A sorting domain-containing protein [Flavobacterium sp.]HSD08278.1 T9SS type A sorting domain-containing protein [Flavobacterium sp.]
MKKILLCMIILFASANIWSQTITETGGWLESAFVKWTAPAGGADSYNVYYTGGGKTNQIIDTQLIRSYGSYFRADVLGLAAGSYTITIKPVVSGTEQAGVISDAIEVKAHDRSGFAHFNYSDIGAYKNDGTLKAGARVIYVSANTAKSVTCTVGGVTYTGLQTIIDAYQKGTDNTPLAVRIIGTIDAINMDKFSSSAEGLQIKGKSAYSVMNISIEGVGDDATIRGFGILLRYAKSVELRNFAVMLCMDDSISLDTGNSNCWVHNLDLFYGRPGSAADQTKGDGTLDLKDDSKYLTLSYNHFWDSGKMSLCGMKSETGENFISYHHNWFDHSDSRHPRVRTMTVHVYNNYFDGNSKYGTGATMGANVFVENNYFRNCKYPMLTAMQGTDIYNNPNPDGTFSGEAGGTIKAFNNTIVGAKRYVPYNATTNPIEFDAIEVATRDVIIDSNIKSKLGGTPYNNFDTDRTKMYTYTAAAAEEVPSIVTGEYGAGRMQKGDFKWTFNNIVDDESDVVNTALKSAITDYTSKMVAVQGEPIPVGKQTLTATSNNNDQVVSAGSAISNIVFTWGDDAKDVNITAVDENGDEIVGSLNGLVATKNPTAKTITLSGVSTATLYYTVTTTGNIGAPSSLSGTITVLPPSSQVITCTTNNSNQTIVKGVAIAPIVLTWSGDATDVTVSGFPTGVDAAKDTGAKTITISGTPTTVGSSTFTAMTSGNAGTPVAVSGTITVTAPVTGTKTHNFTTQTNDDDYFTITTSSNLSTSYGSVIYGTLTLSKCLKLESSTGTIEFDTTEPNTTLTLVMNSSKTSLASTVKVDNIDKSDANGIIVVDLAPGHHVVKRGTAAANVFYIKVENGSSLGLGDNDIKIQKLTLYPNPVTNSLYLSSSDQKIENASIYSITGALVKSFTKEVESIDVSNLIPGTYVVKITTENGSFTQKIIKK